MELANGWLGHSSPRRHYPRLVWPSFEEFEANRELSRETSDVPVGRVRKVRGSRELSRGTSDVPVKRIAWGASRELAVLCDV